MPKILQQIKNDNYPMPVKQHILFFIFFLISFSSFSQEQVSHDTSAYIFMQASDKYYKNKKYRALWGEHYRKEWHTKSWFKKVDLDTLAGGLSPYELGGGRQSKSLKLRDKVGREYVLRSIDKSLGNALPPITRGTFIENFANDQVTFAHPYAALIVAPLARAAGIFHANPAIYYVPKQPALKEFNEDAGNMLFLFEQRSDEDWSTASNFGNANKIIGTKKMFEKILEDNDHSIDQNAFVKARLFDMLIGDWGRHEDQWRWAAFKSGKKTVYVPIPRDRDNAFTKLDGSLLKRLKGIVHADHMQSFENKIEDVKSFNYPARYLDRHLINKLTLEDWLKLSNDLKTSLTDKVIDDAVMQLPKEVYPLSGPDIASKLKSRRNFLDTYAKEYFLFLNHKVELTGTKDDELFDIKKVSDTQTVISIYKVTKENVNDTPFYSRVFNNSQTKEVMIYGIDGKDKFKISGQVNKGMTIRLIGGPGQDSYEDVSAIGKGGKHNLIYDNAQNKFVTSSQTKLHLSNDSAVHLYDYDSYKPGKKSFRPTMFFSNEDRIYVGISYSYQKQQWRKSPYGYQHKIDVKYSLGQKAFSSTYASTFKSLIGKWDLNLFTNYDMVRWTNFYGVGNESVMTTQYRDFNRVRSRQFIARVGVQRVINNRHKFLFNPYFQTYDLINDTARILAKLPSLLGPQTYRNHQYAGAEIGYVYQDINDSLLPTKGFTFYGETSFTQNIKDKSRQVGKFSADINTYLPLTKKVNLHFRTGAATLTGKPEFYQLNTVGSTITLRGYQRDRFYGKSTVYHQNELRWISDVRSHYYNGKLGLYALYDIGRVWLKEEESKTWHTGYGLGLILSPFNKITVTIAYGISAEDTNLHFGVIKAL